MKNNLLGTSSLMSLVLYIHKKKQRDLIYQLRQFTDELGSPKHVCFVIEDAIYNLLHGFSSDIPDLQISGISILRNLCRISMSNKMTAINKRAEENKRIDLIDSGLYDEIDQRAKVLGTRCVTLIMKTRRLYFQDEQISDLLLWEIYTIIEKAETKNMRKINQMLV